MASDGDQIRLLKRGLRRRIIKLRNAMDAGQRARLSSAIVARLMEREEMEGARTVHLFASFGSEVDTIPLIERLLATGRRPVLPIVVRDAWTMEHACIGSLDDLEPGFKGIREPCRGCTKVGPDVVDLVVVPGVAFDRQGRRLGYGGGFYDGFLSTCGAPRIAIAFGVQVVDRVPCDECDLPVGVVITEDEIIEASPGTSPVRS